MASPPYPLPSVQDALSPYIHTRHATRLIRSALAAHLSTPITTSIPATLHLPCPSPHTITSLGTPSTPLSPLHQRYHDAVRANLAARTHYAALHHALSAARSTHTSATSSATADPASAPATAAVHSHVETLRRRRHLNNLRIVRAGMDQLTARAPAALGGDVGAILGAGLAPEAPVEGAAAGAAPSRAETLLRGLKREVLRAKARWERVAGARAEVDGLVAGLPAATGGQEVFALMAARDALIGFMEGELGKITEGGGDDGGGEGEIEQRLLRAEGEMSPRREDAEVRIQELYGVYVEARKRLVASVDAALAAVKCAQGLATPPVHHLPVQNGAARFAHADSLRYSHFLPYVPAMVQAARAERSLVQQALYLRRQLSTASEDTRAVIQRLAGESYMVPPGATDMQSWAKAGAARNEDTDAFVREQLGAGRRCLASAGETLRRVGERREAVRALRGDVSV